MISSFEARYRAAHSGGEPEDYLAAEDQQSLAAKLSGEVDGRFIRCASPGRSAADRSCFVRVDPAQPGHLFIYDCEGSQGAAYAMVRKALGAPTRRRCDPAAIDRIWSETQPATCTVVEPYLRSRAITLTPPAALRFHPAARHLSGGMWPAMVAERRDAAGDRVAIHRTFLRRDGRGKAPVEPQRMDLGPSAGGAIRLAPPAEELLIGEGIETVLAAMQVTGSSGWAAGSAGALRRLILPQQVRSVVICADGDEAGESAAVAAAARWMGEGRRVRIARAPAGKDFNDLLAEAGR